MTLNDTVLGMSRCPAGLNLEKPDPDCNNKYATVGSKRNNLTSS